MKKTPNPVTHQGKPRPSPFYKLNLPILQRSLCILPCNRSFPVCNRPQNAPGVHAKRTEVTTQSYHD